MLENDAKLVREPVEVFEELILLVGLRVPVDVRDSRAEDVALKDA